MPIFVPLFNFIYTGPQTVPNYENLKSLLIWRQVPGLSPSSLEGFCQRTFDEDLAREASLPLDCTLLLFISTGYIFFVLGPFVFLLCLLKLRLGRGGAHSDGLAPYGWAEGFPAEGRNFGIPGGKTAAATTNPGRM